MADKDPTWTHDDKISEGSSEEIRERLQEWEPRMEKPDDEKPHLVRFDIDDDLGWSIRCRTRGYPGRENAEEAQSKLDQIECVYNTHIEQL